MSAKLPKWRYLTEEEKSNMKGHFGSDGNDFVKVGEKEWFLPKGWVDHAEQIMNMEIRKDDTWVITYPRSGTTLTQVLVWLISNNFDFEALNKEPFLTRFPFLEHNLLSNKSLNGRVTMEGDDSELKKKYVDLTESTSIEKVINQPSPRFIKTHLGLELLPHVLNSGCKIVYVARNPKDAIVSWYYFEKSMPKGFHGDLADSWANVKGNTRVFGPYWEHIKEGWAERHRPNFLFLFYEDIVKDLPKAIKKIADFLGKPYTDEQVKKLAEYVNIENFRSNEMINPSELRQAGFLPKSFIRKGVVGDSKGRFSPELEAEIDEWIKENLKDTDIVFPV